MMMLKYIKQHLKNIWSSILNNTEAEPKKGFAYKKKCVTLLNIKEINSGKLLLTANSLKYQQRESYGVYQKS